MLFQVSAVKELVANGANIKLTDINDITPLQLHIRCVCVSKLRIIQIFNKDGLYRKTQEDKEAGKKHPNEEVGSESILSILVAKGADVNTALGIPSCYDKFNP